MRDGVVAVCILDFQHVRAWLWGWRGTCVEVDVAHGGFFQGVFRVGWLVCLGFGEFLISV